MHHVSPITSRRKVATLKRYMGKGLLAAPIEEFYVKWTNTFDLLILGMGLGGKVELECLQALASQAPLLECHGCLAELISKWRQSSNLSWVVANSSEDQRWSP